MLKPNEWKTSNGKLAIRDLSLLIVEKLNVGLVNRGPSRFPVLSLSGNTGNDTYITVLLPYIDITSPLAQVGHKPHGPKCRTSHLTVH